MELLVFIFEIKVRKVRKEKITLNDLLERLKKYKYDTDDTYKNVAIACEIPFSTFYNFSNGTRQLKPKHADSLDKFLASKGY